MRRDHGDQGQVKKRKTKAQLEQDRCQEELRQLLSHKGNRYFLWRLLSECGLYRTSSVDPHNMAIRSGMRDVGIWVITEIFKADEHAFTKMQLEAQRREKENDRSGN